MQAFEQDAAAVRRPNMTARKLTGGVLRMAIALALALIFYLMTKSGFASAVIFIASEVLVFVFYTFKKDSFEGLCPNILSGLSLFARFGQFVSGIFDVTAIVFYITVAAVFLFLSVQAMEKRRWS